MRLFLLALQRIDLAHTSGDGHVTTGQERKPEFFADLTDEQLIDIVARTRSTAAFEIIVRRYLGDLVAHLKARFADALAVTDVEACANAAMYDVWKNADQFLPSKATFRVWLFGIARYRTLDLLNGNGPKHIELHENHIPTLDDALELSADEKLIFEALSVAIDKLSPQQRAIAIADLEAGGEADTKFLAVQLKTTPKTIRSARSAGRKRIESQLADLIAETSKTTS